MPHIARAPVLTDIIQDKLQKDLTPLWTEGKTATEIAKELHFGKLGNPYEKLKRYHVYFYRAKFNLPIRLGKNGRVPGIKKGQSRYKHQPENIMEYAEFKNKLDSECPLKDLEQQHPGFQAYILRKRAYVITHFWCPLRKSEIYERELEDFSQSGENLKIDLFRKKKHATKKEPFFLSLKLPLAQEVSDWIFKHQNMWLTDKNRRPFKMNGDTAWKYVKSVFGEDYFPHFARFNYVTRSVEHAKDPGKLISSLLKDTGLDIQTVMKYIMANTRFSGELNQTELELLQQQGLVK